MKMSEIAGSGFFNIGFTRHQASLIDAHFVGASHHRYTFLDARTEEERRFHLNLYLNHVLKMMQIVRQGDFSKAHDFTGNEMNVSESWIFPVISCDRPEDLDGHLFDPKLFINMCSDVRWGAGQHHPYDQILRDSSLSPKSMNL